MPEQPSPREAPAEPTADERAAWRVFLESALAVSDVLDAELQAESGLTLVTYNVLVTLEEAPGGGLPMSELASEVFFSKSGLTRVVDRLEADGLVRRERPPEDRRVIRVCLTPAGTERLEQARGCHRRAIQEHFVRHLDPAALDAMAAALAPVREHARTVRAAR